MRNKYGGNCYRCGEWCAPGDGHFERLKGRFRVQHATCAIAKRGTPDPERAEYARQRAERTARGTGKAAQRARHWLRQNHPDSPALEAQPHD